MMTDFERGIIDLVKSSITGEKISLQDDFDWEQALKLALKHQIIPMFYYGVKNSDLPLSAEISSNLELTTFSSVASSTKQLHELKKIFKVFDENDIEYMPLKVPFLKIYIQDLKCAKWVMQIF